MLTLGRILTSTLSNCVFLHRTNKNWHTWNQTSWRKFAWDQFLDKISISLKTDVASPRTSRRDSQHTAFITCSGLYDQYKPITTGIKYTRNSPSKVNGLGCCITSLHCSLNDTGVLLHAKEKMQTITDISKKQGKKIQLATTERI